MELTVMYIISQIITVAYYGVLSLSYLLKDRNKILITNFVAHIGQATAMVMLSGYTGAAMAIIMMARDLALLVQEIKKSKGKETNNKFDLGILIITVILVITLTTFTYNGPLSLLSVVATLITTYSVWQKNVIVYKILGIVAGILWLSYNIFIMSIMGIILEAIIIISSLIGFIKDRKMKKYKTKEKLD